MRTTYERTREEIRYRMAAKGMSQRALARSMGCSSAAIQRRTSGEVPFTVPEVIAIADLLHVDPAEFFKAAS